MPYGGGMGQLEVPNFYPNSSYPLGGERIGPAWRAAWSVLLAEPRGVPGPTLVVAMCLAADIVDKTASLLLQKARKAGILEVRYVKGRRRVAWYRIAPQALAAATKDDK
jgi:hypothetical protein